MSIAAIGSAKPVLPTALLIDDEASVRCLVRRMLEPNICHLIEAADGEMGLRVLEQGDCQIDLVITDLLMPGLDGMDVLEVLRLHRPELPVLVTSAFAGSIYPIVNRGQTHRRILHKPFTADALQSAVKVLASQARETQKPTSKVRGWTPRVQESTPMAGTVVRQRSDLVTAAWAIHRQRTIEEEMGHRSSR